MKVAVVGVTGLVGGVILKVLEERNFPVDELIPIASDKSIGKEIIFNGKVYSVVNIAEGVSLKPDIAIFSAGGQLSLDWAEKFAANGTIVIDNSSAWRMDEMKKLIIPEINACQLTRQDKIISNPNCSTIQLLMALNPLHLKYKVKRVVVSTYQSVTGSGFKAKDQLMSERSGDNTNKVYPWQIDLNCLPHCDVFLDNGYTKEEMKLVNETRKIFNDNSINLTATAVRVPVVGGHSESVNVEFENEFDIHDVRYLLSNFPGLKLIDDIVNNSYPMPIYCQGKDDVFVGRVRRDESQANTLNFWVVADNLRKGAATNAVQIAEYIIENDLI